MPPATDARAGARALPFRRTLLVTACALLLGAAPAPADPRPPEIMDAARLRLAIEKLSVTGSAASGRATAMNSSRITVHPSRCRALVSDDLFTPVQERSPASPALTRRKTSR